MKSNRTVSVVVRYHNGAEIGLLADALASVKKQTYKDIEILLSCQDLTGALKAEINALCLRYFPAGSGRSYRILNSRSTANKKDLRGDLLNKGVREATGRYIGYLDYDDVLKPWAYRYLIGQLQKNKAAVLAAGLCTRAFYSKSANGKWRLRSKKPFNKKSGLFQLFNTNFLPIHSFLIDLSRSGKRIVYTKPLSSHEDYYFILNIAARFPVDFSGMRKVVCDYRFFEGNVNSTPHSLVSQKKRNAFWRGYDAVEALKSDLKVSLTISEINDAFKDSLGFRHGLLRMPKR